MNAACKVKSGSPQVVEATGGVHLKHYFGHAAGKDRNKAVFVRDRRGPAVLAHHVRHSPTGFNWGYAGSGPAELARCILLDAFGHVTCPDSPQDCQCQSKWVEPSYQAFKESVVSFLDQNDEWKLDQEWVVDWVFDYLAASKALEAVGVS